MVNRTDKRAVRGDDGFTVVEFVVAATILLIVAVAVMGALAFAATSTAMDTQRQAAVNLANERIEYARNIPYDDLGVTYAGGGYGDPPGPIVTPEQIGDFLVETDVRWARDPDTGRATYKEVTVSVSWDEPRTSNITFETNVYGSSSLVNTGDVLVTVLDNDTFEPIEDALVSIDPSSGVTRELKTTEEGEAFFGFVEMGDVVIDVQVAGYLVDLSSVEGARVQSDRLNSYTVHAQLASTGIVRVVDTSGNPISGATVEIESDAGVRASLVTGADGRATFTELLNGEYSVLASAPGRADGHGMFVIESGGETVTTEVSLADAGVLSVMVLHGATGSPIEGATVHVGGPAPGTDDVDGSPATTASSGEVAFDLFASGEYEVTAFKLGFESRSTQVNVTVGTTASVEIHLTPIESGSLRLETGHYVWRWDWGWVREWIPEGNIPVRVHKEVGAGEWDLIFEGRTDSGGIVDIADLEPGTYRAQRRRTTSAWSAWVNPPVTFEVLSGVRRDVRLDR